MHLYNLKNHRNKYELVIFGFIFCLNSKLCKLYRIPLKIHEP